MDGMDRLERFMLETGGESHASDRIQENIDSLRQNRRDWQWEQQF